MTDAAFHADRLTGIGGSQIADLFSLPPYGCARALMYEKLQIPADYPRDENAAMRRGKALEAAAAEEYEILTGNKVAELDMLRRKDHPWATVHVDRLVWKGTDLKPFAIAEIKVPGPEMFLRTKREGLNSGYILQCQHGMWVAEHDRCEFILLEAGRWECITFPVMRNEEMIESIAAAGDEFWEKRSRGELPEKLPLTFEKEVNGKTVEVATPQCSRCSWRTTCQGDALIPVSEQGELQRDDELLPLVEEYVEAKRLEDEAGELVAIARAPLEKAIGERPGVEVPGFRVHFRQQAGSMRFNEERAMAKVKELNRARVKVDYDGTLVWPAPVPVTELKKAAAGSRPMRVYAR